MLLFFFMNPLAKKYYETGGFQEVLFLSEKTFDWETLSFKVPELPRSWYELAYVPLKARIEFLSNLWGDHFTYHPIASAAISHFFSSLDDVEIALIKNESLYSVEMVYSMKDNCSFFRGFPPVTEQDIRIFQMETNPDLPKDYCSFFLLHNGFGKLSEMGLLQMSEIPSANEKVTTLLQNQSNREGRLIDPKTLIPFFETMGSFQCFFSDWYPNSEMGNVFLSGINYTVSDTTNSGMWEEECAFPTFLEWLSRYLRGMNISH